MLRLGGRLATNASAHDHDHGQMVAHVYQETIGQGFVGTTGACTPPVRVSKRNISLQGADLRRSQTRLREAA